MEFRLLGPVEVEIDGRTLPIVRPQHRGVLGLLLLEVGQVVTPGRIEDALWGPSPPPSARSQIQVCVSRIRAALRTAGAAAALSTVAGGYRVRPGSGRSDLAEFDRLVAAAAVATTGGDPDGAARALRAALDLWRGPALGGAAGVYVEAAAAGLAERRLRASERLAAVELARGDPDGAVGLLRPLVDAHPLHESLVGRLMLALASRGDQAGALALYTATRDRLAAELGVAPSAGLAAAHLRVLRQQTGPPPAATRRAPGPARDHRSGGVGPAGPVGPGRRATGRPASVGPGEGAAGRAGLVGPGEGAAGRAGLVGPGEGAAGRAGLVGPGEGAAGRPGLVGPGEGAVGPQGAVGGGERSRTSGRRERRPVTNGGRTPRKGDQTIPVPAQLPTDVPGFTGRTAALAELDRLAEQAGATVVISAIGGTAGVGKTALAIHFAHRVAARFPDGQLYVNLRGFDLDGRAVEPETALRGFLAALGIAARQIPAGRDEQAALLRTRLADRRVLMVLDNARDADQVRPLLPGTGTSLVLVTSRHALTGLTVAEGARPLTLTVLSTVESRALLVARLGPRRVAAEPAAVEEIIARCAHLPLALAVVAARASSRPDVALAQLAADLALDPLAAFDDDDPGVDVRAVFAASYRTLDPAAATVFRHLGLHPGPDASAAALAALTGLTPTDLRPALRRLTRAHLVTEPRPDRYTLHDLLRAYAAQLGRSTDPQADRDQARGRLYDHYRQAAYAADQLIDPYRLDRPPAPDGPPVTHADHAAALRWLVTEHAVLLATVAQAAGEGFGRHAHQLAAALTTYLDRCGHWSDLARVQTIALRAARDLGDRPAQAQAQRGLAIVATWLDRPGRALRHYRRGLALQVGLGDQAGRAHTHIGISWVLARQGRYEQALLHSAWARDLFATVDFRPGQAKALNNIGWLHGRLGHHEQARRCCEAALALHTQTGDRHGAALSWDNLGYAEHRLGRPALAIDCYRRALALHRTLGDRYDEADVLTNLGDTHHAVGDPAAARTAWSQALRIYVDLGHPDAEGLRGRLRAAPGDGKGIGAGRGTH